MLVKIYVGEKLSSDTSLMMILFKYREYTVSQISNNE